MTDHPPTSSPTKTPVLRRSQTALPSLIPSRDRAPTSPQQQSSKRSHLHLHHHHRHHHNHGRNGTQSAVQPHAPTTFGDVLNPGNRAERRDRNQRKTPESSRRESLAPVDEHAATRAWKSDKKPVKSADVTREQARGEARDSELRTSLHTLSELSHTVTRRLDDTYYAILERVSILQSTISALYDLSVATKNLHATFRSDAQELETEVTEQIDAFGGFEQQGQNVKGLDERLKASREKARALSSRLEDARHRVELWEKREGEWQARTSRRLRVMWAIVGGLVALGVALWVWHRSRVQRRLDMRICSTATERAPNWDESPMLPSLKGTIDRAESAIQSRMAQPPAPPDSARSEAGPRLRRFGEL
ncbi:hypothetical protein B0A49_09794 [Cryomyces minteri]|uniref:Uncharacterized protein n=1 Tax=Cryomyces minteri TaxID=331657 RepID=A0A4U0X585_9PEZI|nr:hypothetical protein B0A49_09794 [Cryomyces minteri]